jgi:hypothetical protein
VEVLYEDRNNTIPQYTDQPNGISPSFPVVRLYLGAAESAFMQLNGLL